MQSCGDNRVSAPLKRTYLNCWTNHASERRRQIWDVVIRCYLLKMRRKQNFIATSIILRSKPFFDRTLLKSLLARKRSGGINQLIWVLLFWICQNYICTGFNLKKWELCFTKKARVMYPDPDSLFYEIETDDICKDLVQLKHRLDLSDYPKDHYLQSELNKKSATKVIG